jgi:hypothetical protein
MSLSHVITEWVLDTNASEIPIHLYWIPQKNMDAQGIESDTGRLKYQVRRENDWMNIQSAAHLLGAFEEIKKWGDVKSIDHDYRVINLDSPTERRLLERLLAEQLRRAQDPKRFRSYRNKPILYSVADRIKANDYHVSRVLKYDITVDPKGSITVGFDLSHEFTFQKSLYNFITERSPLVKTDCKVRDIVKHNTWTFKRVSDKPISYPFIAGQNLIEYYQHQGLGRFVESIPPDTPAVVCVNSKGEEFHFIPQLLRLVCTWETVPKYLKDKAKLTANERMDALINKIMNPVLSTWSQNESHFQLRYKRRGLVAQYNGYKILRMKNPVLEFGKGVTTNQKVTKSLLKGGVWQPPTQPVEVQFLIDQEIASQFTQRKKSGEFYFPLFEQLADLSKRLGVPLLQPDFNSGRIKRIPLDDPFKLREKLREVSPQMISDHPILVVVKQSNLKSRVGSEDFYTILKRELGRENALRTQVVAYETSEKLQQEVLMNLLLGIYVKLGIHPWRLQTPLQSECLIGVDVYHDRDIHITGVVQVVGQDGIPLWTKPMSNVERGEIIRPETWEEVIFQTLMKFKQKYGRLPRHLTFHRDGKDHKGEVDIIQNILQAQNIPFDYVAIQKKVKRRLARKPDNATKETPWENPKGDAYVKFAERTAFLCTTNPSGFIGMAQPFRVTQKTSVLPFEKILYDVYNLTFMNLHAINPSRLPSTINYADKTASFFARGLLPMVEMPIQSV